MGKTSKWIKNIFHTKKQDNKKDPRGTSSENPATTPVAALPTTPKEKRRWSFRRSSGTGAPVEPEDEQKRHALAVATATAAAADAAVAAAQAAAAVIRLTKGNGRRGSAVEEVAAVKIQAVFRGYLARKALSALRGLVKLQALVRGHLVRKQAAATLRCMQALVTVQARARMHRIKLNDDYSLKPIPNNVNYQRQLNHRKSTQENRYRPVYNEMDKGMEENIKIVEMDYGDSKPSTKGRNSYSIYSQTERTDHRFSTQSAPNRVYTPKADQRDVSPAPSAMSALTEIMSPRACSNHFEEYCFNTAQSSPQCYSAFSKPHEYSEFGSTGFPEDHPFYPSYMANTQSSRAKARSQSAPKSRPENSTPQFERQTSKRRPSIEGRNVPRAMRMQRSSSHVGSAAQNYHYPWAVKLDKSSASIKDSECGSTSTMLTNTQYCRSLVGFEVNGSRH